MLQGAAAQQQLPAGAAVWAGQAVPTAGARPQGKSADQGDPRSLRGGQRHPQAAQLHDGQLAR